MYAILSHGGRQYRVSAGDRLVVDRLDAEVGSVVALEPILLTGGDGEAGLGKAVDGMRVAVTVVAHTRGRKLRIFKYKAKKRSRKMAGYRSDLTELRVESILTKGTALPKPSAAARSVTATAEVPPETTPVTPRARKSPVRARKPDVSPAEGIEAVAGAAVVEDSPPVAPKTRRRTARAPGTETDDGS